MFSDRALGFTLAALVFSCLITSAQTAQAACANPAGVEGEIIYNKDQSVPQYCDGAIWIGIGWKGGPASKAEGPAGAVQFNDGNGRLAADAEGNFLWYPSAQALSIISPSEATPALDVKKTSRSPDSSLYPTATTFGDVVMRAIGNQNSLEIGVGRKLNDRKGWILMRHNSVDVYGAHLGTLHIQPVPTGVNATAAAERYRGVGIMLDASTHVPYGRALTLGGDAFKPGGGSFGASSDVRLKNVEGEYIKGLEAISALRPVVFKYKAGNARGEPTDKAYVGLLAQEVEAHIPEAVSMGDDGYYNLDSTPILYTLINAVKALRAENEALRQDIEDLKNRP